MSERDYMNRLAKELGVEIVPETARQREIIKSVLAQGEFGTKAYLARRLSAVAHKRTMICISEPGGGVVDIAVGSPRWRRILWWLAKRDRAQIERVAMESVAVGVDVQVHAWGR